MVSMITVHPDGKVEATDKEPTYLMLTKVLAAPGEDLPIAEKVNTHIEGVALWVNESYVRLTEEGLLERNPIGTGVALDLGAPAQPYAGAVVFTDLKYDPMEGYEVAPLDPRVGADLLSMISIYEDIAGTRATDWRTSGPVPPEAQPAVIANAQRQMEFADAPWRQVDVSSLGSIDDVIDFLNRQRG